MAKILDTHTPELFRAAVDEAAERLRAGELVALPTETVYGLAANAWDAAAVGRIFQAKGRPAHNPIIVHVAGLELARQCVAAWPQAADRLAKAFWPGPLTVVLPRSERVPDPVTAGGATVGVRWPSHPFIQAVIRRCGFPLAAPSANPSTAISPTTAAHVAKCLGEQIKLIVDGGPSQVGIESTVVDLTVEPPQVLRPGMIHEESLLAVVPEWASAAMESGKTEIARALRSPGLLLKHYSPQAPLHVMAWDNDDALRQGIRRLNLNPVATHVIAHRHVPSGAGLGRVSVIPHDAPAFARAIYAELHRCDEEGAGAILVEAVPGDAEWQAIRDRLSRAAGRNSALGGTAGAR